MTTPALSKKTKQNDRKLTRVRMVASLVTICFNVQLFNNSAFVNA